jgi:hypothetical protein
LTTVFWLCEATAGSRLRLALKENVNGFLRISVAASAVVLSVGGAAAQTRGDWVLARYKGGQYWYPSIVQTISGERLTIAYDDGDRETLNLSNVRPYDWAIGHRVECNFKGAGKWYPGVIASLAGETIGINYDDGDRERTKTGRCRSR